MSDTPTYSPTSMTTSTAGSRDKTTSGSASRDRSTGTTGSREASGSRDKLMENVQALATHADELMKATSSISEEGVALARRNLAESLQTIRTQVSRWQAMAVESTKQAVQATDSYVRRNPWQAVGIAAMVGVVFGFVSRVQRRRGLI